MVAILRLTPEEVEQVLLGGALIEPGYRPFPTGRRSTYERQEETRAEAEGREAYSFPDDRWESFDRRLAAQNWNRNTSEVVILVAEATRHRGFSEVIAISRAVSGPRIRGVAGARLVTFGPWVSLDEPLSFDSVVEEMSSAARRATMRRILDEPCKPIPPATALSLLEALEALLPDVGRIISSIPEPSVRHRRPREMLEQREANATALSFLTPRWRSLIPVGGLTPPALTGVFDGVTERRSEDDFITDDSAVFPGWERGQRPQEGWWSFQHRNRVLWIKNINVSTAESISGGDLLYVHDCPRAIVLVQYKLLERTARDEVIFRPDDRFRSQVSRLLDLRGRASPDANHNNYRLSEDFVFMKFVDPQSNEGLRDDELTPGRYFPIRFLDRWLASSPSGPKGGIRFDFDDQRSISPPTFAALVRGVWIGSRGEVERILAEIERDPNAELTFAVSEDIESGDDFDNMDEYYEEGDDGVA
jgi:hypothetical protein